MNSLDTALPGFVPIFVLAGGVNALLKTELSNYFNHLNSPVSNLEIIVQDMYCQHALPMNFDWK